MGVLGGFKNMLRTWKNNLKRKKIEKQKKKTKEKKNKISFLYSLLAIVIYPFTVIFKNNNKISIKSIEKKIETSKKIEEIDELKDDFEQIRKKVNKIKQKEIEKKISDKQQIIKQEKIEKELKEKNIKQKQNLGIQNIDNNINIIEKTNVRQTKVVVNGITFNELLNIENEENKIVTSNNTLINKSEKNINITFDAKIKQEFDEEIKKITEEIIDIEKYNDSYQILYKIEELKEKIDFLKEEFKKNNLIFEDNLSFEDIEKLEEEIKKIEKELESKKKVLLNPKREKEIVEEEKQTKKEDKKKNKKETKKEDDEFELCSRVVIENIEKCNVYYNNYLKEIKKYNKKNILFRYMNILSGSALSFMVGIFPFKFIKNRILRNYIIAINTNNTIRTMNRMLNPLNTNNYYLLMNQYRDLNEVIQNTYSVMNDSLERVLRIKEDLINLNVHKIDYELYNKILNMESLISQNIKQIDEKNKDLNNIYVKIKKS